MTKKKLLMQPPAVVERYVRLRMLRAGRSLARRISRPRIWLRERKRRRALAGAMETIVIELARAKRHGFSASCAVLNLALFFLVAERDIQDAKLDALTHPDAWRRSLCTRVILLTIHELDLDKAAGATLRAAMAQAKVSMKLQRQVSDCLKEVRVAQEMAREAYAPIRHATIAHRDPDALQQHRAIVELDAVLVLKAAEGFYAGVSGFLAVIPALMKEVGSFRGLVAQLAEKERRQQASAAQPGGAP